MNTQPEALRLADALSNALKQHDAEDQVICVARWFVEDSAAEMRRLHSENELLWKEREEPQRKIELYIRECNRLESERDELLNTLRWLDRWLCHKPMPECTAKILTAIAKAEGQS